MFRFSASLLLLLAAGCVPTVFAQGAYVQGQALLDGKAVSTSNLAALRPGQVLAMQSGSADVRLSPGAVLRLGQDSVAEVVAADSRRNEVRLQRGRANVVVNHIGENTLLLIDLPQGQTQIMARGLYAFNVEDASVRVFDGDADAFPGGNTTTDIKPIAVHDGHEVIFGGARVRSVSFDREEAQSDLLAPTLGENALGRYDYGDGDRHDGSYYGSNYVYGPYGYNGFAGYGLGYPYGGYYGYGYPYGGYGFYPGFGYWGGGYPYRFGFGGGYGYGGFYGGGYRYRGGFGYGGTRGGFSGGGGGIIRGGGSGGTSSGGPRGGGFRPR